MKIRRYSAVSFSFLLLATSLHAAAPDPVVQEIENGACWLSEVSPGRWKIASFNDRSSGVVSPELLGMNLFSKMEARLRELGFTSYPARDFQIHLLCSGGGNEITLSLAGDSIPICVTTNLRMTKFEVDANHSTPPGQGCSRSIPGEVIFFPNLAEDSSALALLLQQRKDDVQDAVANPGWVTVRLQPRWVLREEKLRDLMMADSQIAALTSKIIPNYRMSLVGTSVDLGASHFPGF